MDTKFGTSTGSMKAVPSELAKYMLDLVAVREVRWTVVAATHQIILYFSIKWEC